MTKYSSRWTSENVREYTVCSVSICLWLGGNNSFQRIYAHDLPIFVKVTAHAPRQFIYDEVTLSVYGLDCLARRLFPVRRASCKSATVCWNKPNVFIVFICPFEKRLYYAVAMSARPSFPDFFQHALRYQFETWYIYSVGAAMSRLSFITIGSLWPTLQLKWGPTIFVQSWLQSSREIYHIW